MFKQKPKNHESKISRKRKINGRSIRSFLPMLLMMIFVACLTVGGTLAYMQAQTGTVTNTFQAGEIEYKLNLEANAGLVEHKNSDVTMPTTLEAKQSTSLSVGFTPDKNPSMTGYIFEGWYYDAACKDAYTDVNTQTRTITVKYGDSHDKNEDPNKVEITLYAKWIPITYTVEYYGNNSTSGSTATSTHTYDVAKNLTKNGYVRTGHKFLGWSTDPNATTPTYTDEQSVKNLTATNNDTIKLYAVWKQMDFKVTFDTQVAGVTANPGSKTVTYEMAYGDLATATRTGYILDGWALDKEGTKVVTKDTIVNIAADHTLYAQWTPITYTVKYNANNGSGTTANSIHTYDVEKNLTANGFSRTGYTFAGWNTKADGTGTSYSDQQKVVNLTSANGATVNLYAKWTPITYKITYNLNGGSVSGNPTSYTIETATFTLKNPTRTGYTFTGWTGTGLSSASKSVSVIKGSTGDRTYTANWTPITYTITYTLNGGSVSGNPTSYTIETATFTLKNPTRTGYTFTGWTGTGLSSASKSVSITKGSTGDRAYTANWTANDVTYVVKHWQQNIDAATTQNSTNYTLKDTENKTAKADSTVTPAVKSYTGFTAPSTQTVTVKPDGSTVVNYYYTRNKYTVTLQKDTGIESVSGAGTYHYGKSVTINATLSGGYQWVNWTGTHSTATQKYTFTMPANNVTDKANADPIKYTISYTLNDGSVSGNPTSYTIETETFTLKNPTRTGYTFTGWTGTGLNSASTSVSITKGSTGNRAYTANWKVNSYTVTLKAGTGIASVSGGGSKNYGSSVTIDATLKTGYKWVNWTGESTTSTKNYTFTMPAKNVTYTANGTPITYYVKYNANGGSGSMSNTTHTYDKAANLRANGFSRTGYTFAGWATSSGGGVTYGNQASVTNLSSTDGATVNLYANWTPITYKVVYHSNDTSGGDSKTITDTVTYDKSYTIRGESTFSFGNNILAGWSTSATCNNGNRNDIPIPGGRVSSYLNKTCGQAVSNLTSTNGGTINLYAIWTPKTVEVWAPKSTTFPYGQGLEEQNYAVYECDNGMSSPAGYLWQEHPSSALDGLQGYNKIRKDDLHAYPVGYNSVYRYATPGVIMDITYMNYFRFDIRMAIGSLEQLRQMTSGQIEFTSSGVCDNSEISALWSTIWANSYYVSHYNKDTGDWISVYVPLNIFTGSTNKAAINFVGLYWNGGTDIGLKAFMCDPRFEYALPSGAKQFSMARPYDIDFSFDISIDELGAFANSEPVAGEDFIMEFFPAEGYAMPEKVLVRIDDVDYYYTIDDLYAGNDDEGRELYLLWIPGDMLTPGCSLYIQAIAVSTNPQTEIEVTWYLSDMIAEAYEEAIVGNDYELILTPNDGYMLPDVLCVRVDDMFYDVYTDGLEHRDLEGNETELPPMPTFDPETNILTIPGELITGETKEIVVIADAVKVEVVTATDSNAQENVTDSNVPETPTDSNAQENTEITEDGGTESKNSEDAEAGNGDGTESSDETVNGTEEPMTEGTEGTNETDSNGTGEEESDENILLGTGENDTDGIGEADLDDPIEAEGSEPGETDGADMPGIEGSEDVNGTEGNGVEGSENTNSIDGINIESSEDANGTVGTDVEGSEDADNTEESDVDSNDIEVTETPVAKETESTEKSDNSETPENTTSVNEVVGIVPNKKDEFETVNDNDATPSEKEGDASPENN